MKAASKITTQAGPSASAVEAFFAISADAIGTARRVSSRMAARTLRGINRYVVPVVADIAHDLGTLGHFIARTQVPGRYNRKPGTGNIIPTIPWLRQGVATVHKRALQTVGFGGTATVVLASSALALSYVGPMIDGAVMQPAYDCIAQGEAALDGFGNQYKAYTQLTGVAIYPTPAVHQGISDACHVSADGAMVAGAVQNRTLPAVDAWLDDIDGHYAAALTQKVERDAYYSAIAADLARTEAEMPERRARAKAREAALIAAHRPHRAPDAAVTTDDPQPTGS